jgi:hypothetical protein
MICDSLRCTNSLPAIKVMPGTDMVKVTMLVARPCPPGPGCSMTTWQSIPLGNNPTRGPMTKIVHLAVRTIQ